MKTGIVVLNYNDAIETIDFVEKISTFNAVDIICVVDNCSTDDSVKQLKKLKIIIIYQLNNLIPTFKCRNFILVILNI